MTPSQNLARSWASLSFLLLVMTGCHLPQLCCPDPGPVLPDDYNGATSEENSAQVGIGEFFNDPLLTQLLTDGLARNQELKIRNQEVRVARNEIMARRGAYLPFVNIGARGGFDRNSRYYPFGAVEDQVTYPGGGKFPDPLTNVGVFSSLRWQVDIWRQLRNSRDAAIQRYYEALEARNYLITQLVAETAENYYELSSLDKRLDFVNQTIEIQSQSLQAAKAQKEAARSTELAVQRFLAEVRRNESQRMIVDQRIIEVENRINFLVGRYPQRVERQAWDFINLDSRALRVGVPADLLRNRRDIRAAELEIAASGLDVRVARANFFPRLDIAAGVGFEAFDPRFLFDPGAFIARTVGELVAPLINKQAIRAEYLNANARQLQAIYNYQRTVLEAFTEVVNLMSKAENYRRSVEIKREQVLALEESVKVASNLFQRAHPDVEYMDVLFAQRDLLEARTVLIETKQQQLSAIVKAYQALGGGFLLTSSGQEFPELFCQPAAEPDSNPVPQAPFNGPLEILPEGEVEPAAPATEMPATETPGTETPGTETPGTETPAADTQSRLPPVE